ncbi:Nramp family divalent metal transporter [Christiangramia portivictoriae]|uniref:Nramp family divalent metal transporter n=1 Tax=Christiangramia portivictoriae TaxID=326069 RepID=UPI0004284473|nr:Nramp family divalent metal transporter [Christiangramia portivictoriae]
MPARRSLLRSLGPGLLLAGAAIGVSHLVQATRAGADYGFFLIWILVLACITKYPFLEFGPRYAASTGEHLIQGYRRLGKWPYALFIFITVGSMFIIQAAVTIVTAGLAELLFGISWGTFNWSLVISGICIALLLIGRYPALDKSMKFIVSLLGIATLITVVLAFGDGRLDRSLSTISPDIWNTASIAFIIAFMGWMPIPLDAAVWHSIWTREKSVTTGKISTQDAFVDFNVGYLAAAIIGLLFFLMGALMIFGSNIEFSGNAVQFSSQLVALYGATLGPWSETLVAIAAFIAMLSTTLAVTDAFPRVLSEIYILEKPEAKASNKWNFYRLAIFIIPAVALVILSKFSMTFTALIDFATALSFLSAPLLAWFNYKLVTSSVMKKEDQPGKQYRILSLCCLAVLVLFNFVYIYTLLN